MINRFLRSSLVFAALFITCFYAANAQLITGKAKSGEASEHIHSLQKGALIVPLFVQLNKRSVIKSMLASNNLDEGTRKKLVRQLEEDSIAFKSFNSGICNHFNAQYTFSKVFFIYDHQLKQFDPNEVVFVNPTDLQPDPGIKFEGEDYYFLQYFNYSSPATAPDEVRFFYVADRQKNRLNSPFPYSPGRWDSFKQRFRQMFGMEPEKNEQIKQLTLKLNEALFRYSKN